MRLVASSCPLCPSWLNPLLTNPQPRVVPDPPNSLGGCRVSMDRGWMDPRQLLRIPGSGPGTRARGDAVRIGRRDLPPYSTGPGDFRAFSIKSVVTISNASSTESVIVNNSTSSGLMVPYSRNVSKSPTRSQ